MDEKATVADDGFTLIEMSIVLVIIGLIVGGVLVGQDLIHAARVRAQLSQIEKFNTAVNTFYGKYQALPGDMNATTAAQYGIFAPRGSAAGQGDGDGLLEGNNTGAWGCLLNSENFMFWQDLGVAGLIEDRFPQSSYGSWFPNDNAQSFSFFPAAKLGRGNVVYTFSGGIDCFGNSDGHNYFTVAYYVGNWQLSEAYTAPMMMVSEAYAIDNKVDDGKPQNGRVTAMYVYYAVNWAAQWAGDDGGHSTPMNRGAATTAATPGSSITCYDNSSSADGQTTANGNPQHYSMEMNHGAGLNCALSFQFQGGD